MGEATNRRAAAEPRERAPKEIDRDLMAQAARRTVAAITDLNGADCLIYAVAGALALQELGLRARAVAGYASWRVGPGNGDMISHDPSCAPTTVHAPASTSDSNSVKGRASMFHSWIEIDTPDGLQLVDFTTFQLHEKARTLDAADGGYTQVDFCPDYIWQAPPQGWTARKVTNAMDAGVFSYERVPSLDAVVLSQVSPREASETAAAMATIYRILKRNEEVCVVGIDRSTGQVQREAPQMSDGVANGKTWIRP